jgi:hypothetical protein
VAHSRNRSLQLFHIIVNILQSSLYMNSTLPGYGFCILPTRSDGQFLDSLPFVQWKLVLQPYWISLVSTIILTFVSIFLNFIIWSCTRWFWSYQSAKEINEDSSLELSSIDPSPQQSRFSLPTINQPSSFTRSLFQPPHGWWYVSQFLVTLIHLGYIIFTCDITNTSSWHQYQEIYARWVNSGAFNVLSSLLFQMHWQGLPSSFLQKISIFMVFCYSPPLFTHVIPMAFIYPQILIIGLVVLGIGWYGGKQIQSSHVNCCHVNRSFYIGIVGRILLSFLVLLICQSLFNYGILFYDGPRTNLEYLFIVEEEFLLRSTTCYISSIQQELSMTFSFLSFL